jgi:hypothetical protein
MVTKMWRTGGWLTIGGYESAWLADLAKAFLLETIDQNVFDETKYFGIYHTYVHRDTKTLTLGASPM